MFKCDVFFLRKMVDIDDGEASYKTGLCNSTWHVLTLKI